MTDETASATEPSGDGPSAEELAAAETSEQRQVRLDKRAKLLDAGIEAYPAELPITTTIPPSASSTRTSRRARRRRTSSGSPAHRVLPQHRQALLRDAAVR